MQTLKITLVLNVLSMYDSLNWLNFQLSESIAGFHQVLQSHAIFYTNDGDVVPPLACQP